MLAHLGRDATQIRPSSAANTPQMLRMAALRPLIRSSHPPRPFPSPATLVGAVSDAALPPRTFPTLSQRPASLATFAPPERASTAVEDASTPVLAATAARWHLGRQTSSYQRLRDIHSENFRCGRAREARSLNGASRPLAYA